MSSPATTSTVPGLPMPPGAPNGSSRASSRDSGTRLLPAGLDLHRSQVKLVVSATSIPGNWDHIGSSQTVGKILRRSQKNCSVAHNNWVLNQLQKNKRGSTKNLNKICSFCILSSGCYHKVPTKQSGGPWPMRGTGSFDVCGLCKPCSWQWWFFTHSSSLQRLDLTT